MDNLIKRLENLEYYQQLLMEMLPANVHPFNQLIIRNGLSKREVAEFYNLCDTLSIKYKKQKAEGFVYHTPLFKEFKEKLHPNLKAEEVVDTCLTQDIHPELMVQLKNSL